MRFRANVYKQPDIPQSRLDSLANAFLFNTSVAQLPPSQQAQARNVTAEIYVIQQGNQNLTFSLAPAPTAGASGETGGGGAVTPAGGAQIVRYPVPTIPEGDIDGFVQIDRHWTCPRQCYQRPDSATQRVQPRSITSRQRDLVPRSRHRHHHRQ